MMHQQSMMVGDMIPVEVPVPEELNNVGYETGASSVDYNDLFPALPHSQPPVQRATPQITNKLRVGSSLHTQVIFSYIHPDGIYKPGSYLKMFAIFN